MSHGDEDARDDRAAAADIAVDRPITAAQLGDVFHRSGIRRPADDLERLQRMLDHANLVATAWQGERLVGVARCFADYAWVCYLSDLAVDRALQGRGVGRALIGAVRAAVGPSSQLVLLAAPGVEGYYEAAGFERATRAFIVKRASG